MSENLNDKNLVKDFLKRAKKIADDSTLLSNEAAVKQWIDTGSMSLNAICSGSLYKGIPGEGKMTLLYGDSGVGKTLFGMKILSNAYRQHGMIPVVFDCEDAVDSGIACNVGLNPELVIKFKVKSIEDCRNKASQFLKEILLDKTTIGKFCFLIDSLAMPCEKELKDVDEDKDAADMGQRAKALSSLFRVVQNYAGQAKVPVICTNHTYENPSEMHKSAFKVPAGGKKQIYMSWLAVQLSAVQEKADDNTTDGYINGEMVGISKNIRGLRIRALTTKNRSVPKALESEVYLNYTTGLVKHGGLFDMAIAMGVLTKNGVTFAWGDDPKKESIGRGKTLKSSKDFWDKCLPKLEAVLQQKVRFSDLSNFAELEETEYTLEDELAEDENEE